MLEKTLVTVPIARIMETFLGSKTSEPRNQKVINEIAEQVYQRYLAQEPQTIAQLGRGKSTIKSTKRKAKIVKTKKVKTLKVKTPKVKVQKAWFKQIRIIYAIDFAIYGSKLHATEVSKSYRHSFDLAKAKITQLEKTQKHLEIVAN